ncbi:MAG: hypothetical protein Q9172_000462 [Xanthocarpia lactea]
MDENTHSFEIGLRKDTISEKLNKLTNSTFSRHRTSGTTASFESFSSQPRRPCIPTPSLGSRTSSLFNGLGLDTRDHTDSSGTQRTSRKDSSTGRSTTSSRRYSRQFSESTSSFFGNHSLGPLYPREFLDEPDTGVEKKENKIKGLRLTEDAHSSQRLQTDHHPPLSSLRIGSEVAQATKTDGTTSTAAKRNRGSDIPTQSTVKTSRRISDRLANTPFFKHHSARHSIAVLPLASPVKAKDVQERRLMAPINPPLPRSTTMGRLNGPSAPGHDSSPRTPNFTRPTSSSVARRSEISKTYKTPPIALTSASGQKTADMPGFFMHRERKRAEQEAAMTLGSHLISHESTPGFLPGNGPQIMARDRSCAVQERAMTFGVPEHWARQNLPSSPPRIPDRTTSAEANFNSHAPPSVAMSPQRYPLGPRYGSISGLNVASAVHEVQPPVQQLPRQPVTNSMSIGDEGQRPRCVAQGSRIPRSTSNTAFRNDKLPLPVPSNSFTGHRATPIKFPPRKASLAAVTQGYSSGTAESPAACSPTAPQLVGGAAPANGGNDDDEVDLTLIRGAQDLRFWAGRYTAASDRVRNDALISPEAARYGHNDDQRQRAVLRYLGEKCADDEARESLDAFVRAWAHGWSGGVAEAFLGVPPVVPVRTTSAVEEKKKGGFMGKVFGRMKS